MPMSVTSPDPLPLSGEHTLSDFCRRVTASGPSRNASSIISKIELLKDTRVAEHWTHEYLVFTIVRPQLEDEENERDILALYFERGLDEEQSWIDFLRGGFRGAAADSLGFYDAGGEEERERRSWSTSVFEIALKTAQAGPLRLRHLAQILASEAYYEKHPRYGLFSANCWSWSRGVFFDIIRHPRVSAKEVLAFKDGVPALRKGSEDSDDKVVMDKQELELFIITQYGAYGRALLHFTSDDFKTRHPSFVSHYCVRFIILMYSIVGLATAIKRILHYSSNWTVCLRPMLISAHKTTDEKGWDFTSTFLPPNFVKLVSWTPAFIKEDIPSSMCTPGRYLYLLSSPLYAWSREVFSVHIYVFGYLCPSSSEEEDGKEMIDPDLTRLWLSCANVQPSVDKRSIRRTGDIHKLDTIPRNKNQHNLYYSSISTFDQKHPLTMAIEHGDTVSLWAHAHQGTAHVPRIASIKIIARRPIGVLDIFFVIYLAWEMNQWILVGPSRRALQGLMMCVPYVLNTRFEGWVWSNLGIFARALHVQLAHQRLGTATTTRS